MTAAEPSIPELAAEVAKKHGWEQERTGAWIQPGGTIRVFGQPGYETPARLWELEGDAMQAGWSFGVSPDRKRFQAFDQRGYLFDEEEATPEGRVRLVLRAWIEMQR